MYLIDKKSEYYVNLWSGSEECLFNKGDSLPLKALDRNISLNCFIINRFFIFKIEWGCLIDIVAKNEFKGKDFNTLKFYNKDGQLLKIPNYESLDLSTTEDFLLRDKEEDNLKKLGKALFNIDKLHIWEREQYNKNMRIVRSILRNNDNIVSSYLNWIDTSNAKQAYRIIEGILTIRV